MQRKKNIKVKKWKAPNGNICFQFPMRKTFERPWIIISAILFTIIICIVEFFIWGNLIILATLTIILFSFSLWWLEIPERHNDTIITQTVHEIMDNAVKDDALTVEAKVDKTLVYRDTKGTYGRIETSCFLALLDNGEIWEYPLLYHKSDKEEVFFECERNHFVCENQEHICKISPPKKNHLIDSFKFSEETYLKIFLFSILFVGGLTFAGFCWIMKNFKWWFLLIFTSYVFLFFFTERFYSRGPNKFLRFIRIIISVPYVILYLFFHAGLPFLTIVGTYFFVALFTFGMPLIVLMGLSHLGWLELKPETTVFIVFTFGSILCSHSYSATKWMIHQTPLRDWGNHSYELYREKLAIYLIHPSNVIFLLYFIYFVFLVISGFLQIEKECYLISQEFDVAIFKSFLIFIAFTNMRAKSKETEANVKELFLQTIKLFKNDI